MDEEHIDRRLEEELAFLVSYIFKIFILPLSLKCKIDYSYSFLLYLMPTDPTMFEYSRKK
jgi:hypothetical protein